MGKNLVLHLINIYCKVNILFYFYTPQRGFFSFSGKKPPLGGNAIQLLSLTFVKIIKLTMKRILLVALVATIAAGAQAQSTFFPTKAGTALTYVQNNANGKAESYLRYSINEVEGSGINMSVLYEVEVLDKNRKPSNPPVVIPLKTVIEKGIVTFDMKQMFLDRPKDLQADMNITGMPMKLPSDIEPGWVLRNVDVIMTMSTGATKMMTMTEGKCLAIEEVKVPAGTFRCHKITQIVACTEMNITTTTRVVSWYALGTGIVKTETYNDKDKLQSSMELIELKAD